VSEADSERLDQYVVRQLPQHSRAFGAKLIDRGQVLVNGEKVTKAGYKLRAKDRVVIDYDETATQTIPDIELPVIYEDKACVVINKPAGLLTHSKGAFNPEATVATWLGSRVQGMDGERAGIVHRLDRATSGVMICAKTPDAQAWLQKQFSQRKVKKTYLAVVQGVPAREQAITHRRAYEVRVRPEEGLLELRSGDAVPRTRHLASGVRVTSDPPSAQVISFLPQGITSGGRLRVEIPGRRGYLITLDPLTGRVSTQRLDL